MAKKCLSCRFFKPGPTFESSFCSNPDVHYPLTHYRGAMLIIWAAREICDKEGDGVFVYFQPKLQEHKASA